MPEAGEGSTGLKLGFWARTWAVASLWALDPLYWFHLAHIGSRALYDMLRNPSLWELVPCIRLRRVAASRFADISQQDPNILEAHKSWDWQLKAG